MKNSFKEIYTRLGILILPLLTLYSCQLAEQQFMFPNPVATDAHQVTPISFVARWQEVVGASEYEIDVATDENFSEILEGYKAKKIEDNSLMINNLSANISYFYRIRASISGRISENSAPMKVTTLSLNTPVVYEATDIKSSSFVARWKRDTGVTYLLDIATDANFNDILEDYHQLEIQEDTSHMVQGLDINVQYFYRIQYRLATATSKYSNVQPITTNSLTPPTATSASDTKVFSFMARWEAQVGIELYLLDVATDANFTNFVEGYESKPVTGTSHQLEGLDFRTIYYYRLRAKHLNKTSNYSNMITVPACISPTCKLTDITESLGVRAHNQIKFTYDTQQRLTQLFHPGTQGKYRLEVLYNTDNSIQKVVQYLYDKVYQTFFYTYHNHLLQSIQKNDASGNFLQYWTFTYNAKGQRESWSNYTDQAQTSLIQKLVYIYDNQGNVVQVRDQNNDIFREYIYDDKLNPYALFHPDLCFFIFAEEDKWPKVDFPNYYHFEYRGFLPLHNIIKEDRQDRFGSIYPDTELFIYNYNSKGLAISRNTFYFLTYTMSGCSFE